MSSTNGNVWISLPWLTCLSYIQPYIAGCHRGYIYVVYWQSVFISQKWWSTEMELMSSAIQQRQNLCIQFSAFCIQFDYEDSLGPKEVFAFISEELFISLWKKKILWSLYSEIFIVSRWNNSAFSNNIYIYIFKKFYRILPLVLKHLFDLTGKQIYIFL